MEEALGAAKGERTDERLGYRSGYYTRGLITRIGKIELRVPQDRQGRFRTEVFERYQRSGKALASALAQMQVQGVSTRKVKKITEELCGHSFGQRNFGHRHQARRVVRTLSLPCHVADRISSPIRRRPPPHVMSRPRFESGPLLVGCNGALPARNRS